MGEVHFFVEDITFSLPARYTTSVWIKSVIQQEGYTLMQISFVFCSDSYLHTKNVQYLQHDTLTDVLTFDYSETPETIEGDIYISVDRVRANARSWQHSFMEELQTVMVHGVLHLLGYKDHTPLNKNLMRKKEIKYVTQFTQYTIDVHTNPLTI